MSKVQTRVVNIIFKSLEGSDLLMAISPELKGLVVHGRSEAEIRAKIPGRIKDILEEAGVTRVVSVEPVEESGEFRSIGSSVFKANTEPVAA